MDNSNSDPNNPAPPIPGLGPAAVPPTDPANAPWQTPVQPSLAQPAAPLPGLDQPQAGSPVSNPWDSIQPNSAVQGPAGAAPDPLATPSQTPASGVPDQTAWPSSTSTAGFEGVAPAQQISGGATLTNPLSSSQSPAQATPNPLATNPFLQSRPADAGAPGFAPAVTEAGESPQPPQIADLNQPPASPQSPIPGLEVQPGSDTLPEPTSIPTASPGQELSPENPLQTPSIPLNQNPMDQSLPAGNTEAVSPLQSQVPASSEAPAADLPAEQIATPAPETPGQGPAPENPAFPPPNPGQPGALDLSALQSSTPAAPEMPQAPAQSNALPEIGPQENAPTDLSHLIAGDESHQQQGDVYAPPVVQDQNPMVTPNQALPTTDGSTPPPGKHLNLTKVLLVAGIPIILIVAALSAYLILGIGKPASPDTTDQTSLPVEQTKQQAPLTNPPQKITEPSASTTEPESQGVGLPTAPESSSSGTSLPKASSSPSASLSPAMQAAQRQQTTSSPTPPSSSPTPLPSLPPIPSN